MTVNARFLHHRGELIAQLVLLNLSRRRPGQGIDNTNMLRDLITRKLRPAGCPETLRIDFVSRSRHHDGKADLAPARIRHTNHRSLGNIWKIVKEVLDLGRIHILSSGDEHVFEAIDNEDVAIGITDSDVAGAEQSL
ncbi:hypothetical protein HNQ36_003623 [Afipia massiliensis]|uniref:Uncharacterized protein n=1 Tax=Afipia massiliensis TaxID=211460 RepID=A0A840N0K8_9BRAD|nr:hypothetical protein [Afipia massiliensis]